MSFIILQEFQTAHGGFAALRFPAKLLIASWRDDVNVF